MSTSFSNHLVNLLALALLPVSILLHAVWLPETIRLPAIADAGYVSIITLTFLACIFVTLLTLLFSAGLPLSKFTAGASAYVVLIYFLREADLHRLLTIEHVTRPAFYTLPTVPLWQKGLMAAVFVMLVIGLLYLLLRHTAVVYRKWRAREPWAVALSLWFITLLVSQLCDKSALNHSHVGRAIEENMECWAALFLFLALVQLLPTLTLRDTAPTMKERLTE